MRLLIADDDDYTREGLVDTIEWEQFGIHTLFQARDGQEAVRIAVAEKPDIVLTDIRMPKLSGIEFADKLVQICPDSQLLFMSGYMEVDYLKSAIRLAAVDFIEKPIKLDEVERAIGKACAQLRRKERLDAVRDEKIGLQRRQLADLLVKEPFDKEQALRLCREVGFPSQCGYTAMAVCGRSAEELGDEAMEGAVRFWEEHGLAAVASARGADGLLIVIAYGKQDAMRARYLMETWAGGMTDLAVGIGEDAGGLERTSVSYSLALLSAELFFYVPNRHFFTHDELGERSPSVVRRSGLLAELYKLLESEPEKLWEWLDALCNRFIERREPGKRRVVSLFAALAEALLSDRAALHDRPDIGDPGLALRACRSMEEARGYMRKIAGLYMDDVSSASRYSRLVQDVMGYVAEHYGKAELDLNEIAAYVHLSAAHLGVLFRQETGTTIKQYIGDYRIEMAKKLILAGRCKMNEIAEKCGYGSASYFAKAFKGATDLSPLEYKRNNET